MVAGTLGVVCGITAALAALVSIFKLIVLFWPLLEAVGISLALIGVVLVGVSLLVLLVALLVAFLLDLFNSPPR